MSDERRQVGGSEPTDQPGARYHRHIRERELGHVHRRFWDDVDIGVRQVGERPLRSYRDLHARQHVPRRRSGDLRGDDERYGQRHLAHQLRCDSDADSHADAHSDPGANADADSDPGADADAHSDPGANADADSDPGADADAHPGADSDANAGADPHPDAGAHSDAEPNADSYAASGWRSRRAAAAGAAAARGR
jgi:hypothetical protein